MMRRAMFLLAMLVASSVYADTLSDAFRRAQEMVRDQKPLSGRDNSRDDWAERSPPSVPGESSSGGNAGPSPSELERQRREAERQRIEKNYEVLMNELKIASTTPRQMPPREPPPSQSEISFRQRVVDRLVDAGDAATALQITRRLKEKALHDSDAIRSAIAAGRKPSFQATWDFYKYNRPVGLGLIPEENRCAIQLSMTLGLQPKPGELSLADLGNKELVNSIEGPLKNLLVARFKDTEVASRYYVRAQELANRLTVQFGPPLRMDGRQALAVINGKRGIVFLQNAYGFPWPVIGRRGQHIDLWDRNRIAATATSMPFEKADRVLFWELP
jgi:hypothetical protein